jgi:hypothetical protein
MISNMPTFRSSGLIYLFLRKNKERKKLSQEKCVWKKIKITTFQVTRLKRASGSRHKSNPFKVKEAWRTRRLW